jgi:hypothetical protein
MSNSNWTKQAATTAMAPATEAELEAMRYRGTPVNRSVPPAAANHNPISPITPDGNNQPPQAGNKTEETPPAP